MGASVVSAAVGEEVLGAAVVGVVDGAVVVPISLVGAGVVGLEVWHV